MHLHIMTAHGEDVVCSAHSNAGRKASIPGDVPVEHANDAAACSRCFVCERVAVGSCVPVRLVGETRDNLGRPGDVGKAAWEFGRYRTASALATVVGNLPAARLFLLRCKVQRGEVQS